MKRSLALVASLIMTLQAAAGGASANAVTGDPTDAEVDRSIEFREANGLRSDREWVEDLYRDPDASAELYGLPLLPEEEQEFVRRAGIPPRLEALRRAGESRPAIFGGIHIDQAAGGQVVVSVTVDATTEDRKAFRDAAPQDVATTIRVVAHPLARLEAVQNELREDLLVRRPGYESITGVGYSIRRNLVEISVAPESLERMRLDLEERFGPDVLAVEPLAPDTSAACNNRRDCFDAPWRGGINIDNPNRGIGPCTSAFVAWTVGPHYRLITAGHCGSMDLPNRTGWDWYHDDDSYPYDDHLIGRVVQNAYANGSDCDCEATAIPASWAGHKVLGPGADTMNVLSARARSSTYEGERVCQGGVRSGWRCGEITNVNYDSPRANGITLVRQMVATYENVVGDSGAPVMSDGTQVMIGIHSGFRDNGRAVFTHVAEMPNALGLYVCTSLDDYYGC